MIDLYYWTTPNGHKITIFLEETGLPYSIKPVNIGKGEQFAPAFLAISPNNRIPAIVDHEPADGKGPLGVFESGAILQYLAEKTGKFLPADVRGRTEVMQWLFWQMGGLGPMLGQNHHFRNYSAEKILTPSTVMSRKPNGFTASSTSAWRAESSSPARIRSRTWPVIRGLSRTSVRAKISTTFPISSVGFYASRRVPRSKRLTGWQRLSIRRRAA